MIISYIKMITYYINSYYVIIGALLRKPVSMYLDLNKVHFGHDE